MYRILFKSSFTIFAALFLSLCGKTDPSPESENIPKTVEDKTSEELIKPEIETSTSTSSTPAKKDLPIAILR